MIKGKPHFSLVSLAALIALQLTWMRRELTLLAAVVAYTLYRVFGAGG